MEQDWPTIFIVSAVELREGSIPEDAVVSEEIAGFGVKVMKASGAKCERCWMYHPQVGGDDAHPTLCPRCADVLKTGD